MNWKEISEVRDILREANFREILLAEAPQDIENYLTASEIARKLNTRLDSDEINQLLLELGYKNFINKIGVPNNPDNSAFAVKSIIDEDTQAKKYYIQALWHYNVVNEINEIMEKSEHFQKIKPEKEKNIFEKIEDINKKFERIDDYVAITVKKTGFNLQKDFVVYVSYTIIKNNNLLENNVLFINDNIDQEKTEYYLQKDELTDAAPFDYIKIDLPTMSSKFNFINRRDALRIIYKAILGQKVVFFDKEESRFIKKMFDDEGIPIESSYEKIIQEDFALKEIIDWNEPKQSLKLKKIYDRYNIEPAGTENKYAYESKRLAKLTYRVLSKYVKNKTA